MILIADGNGYISISQRLTKLRSRKDDVLHLGTTKLLGTLLTQYPTHGIGNIALSTSVRSYNRRNTIMKFK